MSIVISKPRVLIGDRLEEIIVNFYGWRIIIWMGNYNPTNYYEVRIHQMAYIDNYKISPSKFKTSDLILNIFNPIFGVWNNNQGYAGMSFVEYLTIMLDGV